MLKGECKVNSVFEGGYLREQFLKPEENNLGFVSLPFAMHWSGNEWDMFRDHLRRLLGQSPLSEHLNNLNNNATDDDDSKELMRLVISFSTPFKPDQCLDPTEEITISIKIKLISNQPVNSCHSDKEQGFLAKLQKNLRWELSQLGFGEGEVTCFDYPNNLVWTWNEDDLAWEAVTPITFKKLDTLELYFGRSNGRIDIQNFWVYLNETGITNKVLQQVYSKRGMDVTELKEMLEEGRFSDLLITSTNGDDKKTEIRAHRLVLSAVSSHFAMMLKNPLKEAETGIVQLPESEEVVKAMLHFIYYGGTERILGATADVVLELLMAGNIYMINDLVEVTGLVINAKIYSWNGWLNPWFSADAAVKLFCFARNVDGQLWKDLTKKAVEFLERKELDQLMSSEGYLNLYRIAEKLGPVFESVLAMSKVGKGNKTATFPNVPEGMTKEEVQLIYDFISASSAGMDLSCNLEIAVGMLVLAEFCGRGIPNFFKGYIDSYFWFDECSPDFLVELFCKARLREDKSWQSLKNIAVRKLKELKPNEMKACASYRKMLNTDPEAAVEFTRSNRKNC